MPLGNTIGGIIQFLCIIWSLIGYYCYLLLKPFGENRFNNFKGNLFPRFGATSDFFYYDHMMEEKAQPASKVVAYAKIPTEGDQWNDDRGNTVDGRKEYYEATNLISKRKNMTDNRNNFSMVKLSENER